MLLRLSRRLGEGLLRDARELVAAMVAGAHPEIEFRDVNSSNVHHGHDGIRHICAVGDRQVQRGFRQLARPAVRRTNWSIRWTFTSGLRLRFSAEGASAGRLADDGRVIEQTDYWNRAGIQGGA